MFPTSKEIAIDYEKIVASNWFTNFGPYEKILSERSGEYIGKSVYSTTVANCTLGLEIAISELFLKDRQSVIMPSFTFVAGAEAIIKSGFNPLMIDINKDSWQPNLEQARLILENGAQMIAGILLCNIFGVGNKEIDQWEILSKEYQIPLIIDTAAGFGSAYNIDERVGARGDCEVFSLHATKPFSVGEGGLITSKNKAFIDSFRSAQNFGFESDRVVHRIGTNAKMQELTCAIGVRQLDKLEGRIKKRQDRYSLYVKLLAPHGYVFQENAELSTIAFVSTLVPEGVDAKEVQDTLLQTGIEARRYYTPALHHQAIIRDVSTFQENNLVHTEYVSKRILSLPLYDDMSDEDIAFICHTLKEMSA